MGIQTLVCETPEPRSLYLHGISTLKSSFIDNFIFSLHTQSERELVFYPHFLNKETEAWFS